MAAAHVRVAQALTQDLPVSGYSKANLHRQITDKTLWRNSYPRKHSCHVQHPDALQRETGRHKSRGRSSAYSRDGGAPSQASKSSGGASLAGYTHCLRIHLVLPGFGAVLGDSHIRVCPTRDYVQGGREVALLL